MRNKSSEVIDLLVFPKHWKLRVNHMKEQQLLSSNCRQSRRPFREMYLNKLLLVNPEKLKKPQKLQGKSLLYLLERTVVRKM